MPQAVVFEVGSSFGYFRKGFTTTNSLTHSLIPRSSLEGIVAAIIGLSYGQYQEKLRSSNIAIQIMSRVRKINIKQMNTNPDWWSNFLYPFLYKKNISGKNIQFSVPASIEVLIDPVYKIYFDGGEDNNDKLSTFLEKKTSYYTPYLGTSSMIAYTKYIGTFGYNASEITEYAPVSSVVPFNDKIPDIKLDKESRFAIEEGLTIHIDKDRIPIGTYKVIYKLEPGPLHVRNREVIQILSLSDSSVLENVIFLPTQISPQ
jgi:CRISPR-associated protein Cas5h